MTSPGASQKLLVHLPIYCSLLFVKESEDATRGICFVTSVCDARPWLCAAGTAHTLFEVSLHNKEESKEGLNPYCVFEYKFSL